MIEKVRRRKIFTILMVFVMITYLLPTAAAAEEEKAIDPETVIFEIGQKHFVKGNETIKTDAAPYIKEIGGGLGRTMVPAAFAAPALGSEPAQWFASERKVVITKGEKTIEIFIGSKEMLVNGKTMQMDVAAEILNVGNGGGRTMLPIAFVAKALDIGYEWDHKAKAVSFYGKTVSFDQTGQYGPESGTETIEGNVVIRSQGVVLNNLLIKGNLTIAEEVGDGDATLNNIIVKGETYIRGGGKDSIHINGGNYSIITVQNVDGKVRIVATDTDGLAVVIAEEASGEEVILEGNFDRVTVDAENMAIVTRGETTVGEFSVGQKGDGTIVTLSENTVVNRMVLERKAEIKGRGTVEKAEVKADGISFETAPKEQTIAQGVKSPELTQKATRSGGGGGGNNGGGSSPVSVMPQMGGSVSIGGITKYGETLTADLSGLTYTPAASNHTPTYRWKRSGTEISGAIGASYTLTQEDIGETITLTVAADGTNAAGSVTSEAAGPVEKADGLAAPTPPALLVKTHNSITLVSVAGYEFSRDGGTTWQNNIFSGLEFGTTYSFVTRIKETATGNASAVSEATDVTTEDKPLSLVRIDDALDTTPAGIVRGVSFSPDGQYLAAAHSKSPYITIYKRDGDTFTKLPDPAELPAGGGNGTAFSSDGSYLAVVHDYAPHLTIYKRSGDTFTKLATPAGLPVLKYPSTDGAYDVSFSPDDTYLAVVHKSGKTDKRYLTIFKRSGDTFTKLDDPDVVLTDPSEYGSGSGHSVAFNSDGRYLTVGYSEAADLSSYLTIYERTGDSFSRLEGVEDMATGTVYSVAFSPDGQYLAAGCNNPNVTIFKRDGAGFEKLRDTGASPDSMPRDIAFSPDSKYVVMILSRSYEPCVDYYVRYGDTFVQLERPDDTPISQGNAVCFSPDGFYVAIGYADEPYLTIYKMVE